MSLQEITTHHIDYLQRAGFSLQDLPADSRSLISAQANMRRLKRIVGVGRVHKGYKPETGQQPFRLISEDVLIGVYGSMIPLAFMIVGSPNGVSINAGMWSAAPQTAGQLDEKQSIVDVTLKTLYQTVELAEPDVSSPSFSAAGLVLGTPTLKPPDASDPVFPIDRVIRAMSGHWQVLVIAHPVHADLIRSQRDSTINELRIIQQRPQAGQIASPLGEHYADLLKLRLKTLTVGHSAGMWRTAVYLLGTPQTYERLASVWRGVYSGDQSLLEPVNVYRSDAICAQLAAQWAMPNSEPSANHNGLVPPGMINQPFKYQTLLTSGQLAAYIHLPQTETSGFAIHAIPSFDVVPASRDHEETIAIGHVIRGAEQTESTYDITRNDLTRHVFVAGVTGAGKTNTIFVLLKEARMRGAVPFLVIEPAKTEYRALLNDREMGADLQIFTLGNENVAPFRMNPLEKPPEIPISVHIDLLRNVFNASFGLWNPLPQILEQCLHRIYADRGWEIATNTNSRGMDAADAYPTLSDLVAEVDRYTQSLNYSGEVLSNMRAALLTRLNSLRIGGKGRMLDVQQSLLLQDILSRPTVLELEAMGDDDDKAFVMGLLFIRIVEYWRTLGNAEGNAVRHVLVIEEAHRLLANVASSGRIEDASPRAKAVETFANILSEVRAYGQGIIIADQVPVKLARDVIKNTNLKIAHRIVDEEDRKALAGSMAMTDEQSVRVCTLTRGQAVIFSEGDDAPLLVQIRSAKDSTATGQPQAWPDNVRIKDTMSRAAIYGAQRSLLQTHAGCTDMGDHAGLACQSARMLADMRPFQRSFTRLIFSTIIDPNAAGRLWTDMDVLIRNRIPHTVDELTFRQCLIYHATNRFVERQGTQAAWTFAQTNGLRDMISRLLLGLVQERGTLSLAHHREFREAFVRLYTTRTVAFPGCRHICQHGPDTYTCFYRYAAADLIADGLVAGSWAEARLADQAHGKEAGGISTQDRWVTSQIAGHFLTEFTADLQEALPPDLHNAMVDAGVQASRCFGQQMLLLDEGTKLPKTIIDHIETLIESY